MNRSIETIFFLVSGLIVGGIFAVSGTPKDATISPRAPSVQVSPRPFRSSPPTSSPPLQSTAPPILKVFQADEWIRVPTEMIQSSNGYSLLPLLSASPKDLPRSTSYLASLLKLSPQENVAFAATLERTLRKWVALQASAAKRSGPSSWSLSPNVTSLEALSHDFDESLRRSMGDERLHVFKSLAYRSLKLLFADPTLSIERQEGGTGLKIVGADDQRLIFSMPDIGTDSPLAPMVSLVSK